MLIAVIKGNVPAFLGRISSTVPSTPAKPPNGILLLVRDDPVSLSSSRVTSEFYSHHLKYLSRLETIPDDRLAVPTASTRYTIEKQLQQRYMEKMTFSFLDETSCVDMAPG